jgi:very-short-patch-repair endonuclease
MTARPFQQYTIQQLEELAARGTLTDKNTQLLLVELGLRSTQRAKQLKATIETRRRDNGPKVTRGEKGGGPHTMTSNGSLRGRPERQETHPEAVRLNELFEQLRRKLLDLSRRNPMLNYSLGPRVSKQLRFVDRIPEAAFALLEAQTPMALIPLPEPDAIPPDERTEEFLSALEHAKVSDLEYLEALAELEAKGEDDEHRLAILERQLRDRVRIRLGLRPRRDLKEVNIQQHALELGISPEFDLPARPSSDNHRLPSLQTLQFPLSLEAKFEKIRDAARLSEQEAGLSTLFMAVGFLEWYESKDSTKANYAPLLLQPVTLSESNSRGKRTFSVRATGDGPETNVTLEKFLLDTQGRHLPDLVGDDEDDEVSVEAYFDQVEAAIADLPGWKVRRYLVLGTFAFGRLAMYADLDPSEWSSNPALQKLVQAILRGTDESATVTSNEPAEDYAVDTPEIEALAPILIHDADASQHSAVVDAMKGANLVVEGPPGTGKSQTITNIIANALYSGRSVLFLSEKLAALQVVKRRLDVAGLGDFCLEVHSDKVSARAMVDSLRKRFELPRYRPDPNAATVDLTTWRRSRETTAAYLSALHLPGPDARTPYHLIGRSLLDTVRLGPEIVGKLKGQTIPEHLLDLPEAAATASSDIGLYAEALKAFELAHGDFAASPWGRFKDDIVGSPSTAAALLAQLQAIKSAIVLIEDSFDRLNSLGIDEEQDLDALQASLQSLQPPLDWDDLPLVAKHGAAAVQSLIEAIAATQSVPPATTAAAAIHQLNDNELSQGAKVIEAAWDDTVGTLSIQQARSQGREIQAEVTGLLDALGEVAPIIRALNLPADVGIARSIALAIPPLNKLLERRDSEGIRWTNWRPAGGSIGFSQSYRRWQQLSREATALARQVPALATVNPTADELEVAANIFAKGGFSRLFSGLSKEGGNAKRLFERLGLSPKTADVSALLQRLAAHLRALSEFENGRDNREAVGEGWSGLDTPFETMAQVLADRDDLSAALVGANEGPRLAQLLLSLDRVTLGQVTLLRPAVILTLATAPASVLGSGPLFDRLDALRQLRTRVEAFVALSELTALPSDSPIVELAPLIDDELARRKARRELGRHPAYEELGSKAQRPQQRARLMQQVSWVARVQAVALPALAKARLLQSSAESDFAAMCNAVDAWQQSAEAFNGAMDDLAPFGVSFEEETLDGLRSLIDALLTHAAELPQYLAAISARDALLANGIADLVTLWEGTFPAQYELWRDTFSFLVTTQRANRTFAKDLVLSRTSGTQLDGLRKVFGTEDSKKIGKDRAAVLESLLKNTRLVEGNRNGPRGTWTEMSLLQNEFRKQKKLVPVRGLLRRAMRSIQSMKPCFMMSPLSLAKYLPRGGIEFDLLVIDEASQMKPEDALGGLLRAKQLVVVGDPKQLPPTDFFSRTGATASDDEEDEDIDSESILEACQKSFGLIRRLKWHYRSKCESLISFSNREFYDGSLITFPVARPNSFSIDLVRVPGSIKARRNVVEAERIAEEAIAFMRHHADLPDAELATLGVVAINSDQRELIFEEISRRQSGDELVQRYRERVEARGEEFFVKNLENVQGDERDYIFISLTYGPEPGQTNVMQRFGPINSRHGHRRLNVLFSRARVRMALFTSMGAVDVRPTDKSAHGVHILRGFLAYVEAKGHATAVRGTVGVSDTDFEEAVAIRLENRGFVVDRQVGVSGFRIDLGIRHPDKPAIYLAGVECDGQTYHSSKSARDRDRLREDVLRAQGWQLVRVWSTNWFQDPLLETDNLVKKLQALVTADRREQSQGYRVEWSEPAAPTAQPEETAGTRKGDDIPSSPQGILDLAPPLARHSRTDTLAPDAVRAALVAIRRDRIDVDFPGAEPNRSILRDPMIKAMVDARLDDPAQFREAIPQYLRVGTDPRQLRYLEEICDLIGKMQ